METDSDSAELRAYKNRVREVAMKAAVTNDWCDVVVQVLADLDIEVGNPKLYGTITVEYAFSGEVAFNDLGSLHSDPAGFVFKQTAIPWLDNNGSEISKRLFSGHDSELVSPKVIRLTELVTETGENLLEGAATDTQPF